jgi:hypothetical protein
MTSRSITFTGFAVILGLAVVWSAVSARRADLVSLPEILARLTRSRVARLIFVLVWAWVGWHLFPRGSGAFE